MRRQYHIILTASWERIDSVLGSVASRLRLIRNVFFSQLAVNIMWYCRLKSQLVYNIDVVLLVAIHVSFMNGFLVFQMERCLIGEEP